VDDNLVTRFCEVVTPRYITAKRRRGGFATTEMGEAMAPASESPPTGGNRSGAGAAPVLPPLVERLLGLALGLSLALALGLSLALAACGDDARPRQRPAETSAPDRAAADPARGLTTELDGASPAFGDAVLAELTGDVAAARAGFERVLAASDTPSPLAARAALHLAQLESRTGKNRHALDLVARASALAPSDVAIADGVAELQADVVAAAGAGDLRGPRIGTPLPGVPPRVADAFAAAERALEQVHKLRPRPIIEALSTSIRAKEDATEDVVLKYRAVAEHGGLALIAASYRAGSLYHDLALGLLFGGVPELRVRALAYLKSAAASYRASLASPPLADAELWRLAAETDLRNAEDVLSAAGDGVQLKQ
jgi:hypothetical protein